MSAKLEASALTATVSLPLAKTKPLPRSPLIVPPSAKAWFAQVTTTLATLALVIVPVPPATLQVWPAGWVFTLTLYEVPVGNPANSDWLLALAGTGKSVPLALSTSPEPVKPLTVPLMEYF